MRAPANMGGSGLATQMKKVCVPVCGSSQREKGKKLAAHRGRGQWDVSSTSILVVVEAEAAGPQSL
jgi:hypothetical protein